MKLRFWQCKHPEHMRRGLYMQGRIDQQIPDWVICGRCGKTLEDNTTTGETDQ